MAISTSQFAELLYPGIAQIFGHKYNEATPLYKKFFKVEKTNQAIIKEQGITSLPTAALKEQGDEFSSTTIFQGYQKEYLPEVYGLLVTITREMVEDDQYNIIKQIPAMAARSMIHTEETIHTNVLNNAFTAGNFVGPDGVALCASNHPLVAGGTGTNLGSADFTQTSLENAILDIMDFRDDQGKRLNINPKQIVAPRSLNFAVRKVLETQYKVGSNDNDINIIANMNLEPIVTNFVTDQDSWFLINDIELGGLSSYVKRETEINKFSDDRTENLNIKISKRFATGTPADWRCIWGSPGA